MRVERGCWDLEGREGGGVMTDALFKDKVCAEVVMIKEMVSNRTTVRQSKIVYEKVNKSEKLRINLSGS